MARRQKLPNTPKDAFLVWQAARTAPDKSAFLEEAYKRGYKAAPLWMVEICYSVRLADPDFKRLYQLNVPEWASRAIQRACIAASCGELKSWDEAFGNPIPQGVRQGGLRTSVKQMDVWMRVRDKHEEEGWPIGDNLFAEVGKQCGFSASTVKNLYSKQEKAYRQEYGGRRPKFNRKIVIER